MRKSYLLLLLFIVNICAIDHCKVEGDEICTTCNPGFTGDGTDTCACSGETDTVEGQEICKYVTNCETYDNTAKCTKCNANHKKEVDNEDNLVVDQNKCTPCPDGQISNGNEATCSSGGGGITPVSNLPAACDTGTSGSACTCTNTQGTSALFIAGSSTVKKCYTSSKTTNCQYGNPNYDDCYQCANNYVFDTNHNCVDKNAVAGCEEYASSGVCAKCTASATAGKYPTNNGARCTDCKKADNTSPLGSNGKVCYKENCVENDENTGNCLKCENNYEKNSGSCQQCGNNQNSDGYVCYSTTGDCTTHNENGVCTKCGNNKYLDDSNDCIPCSGDTHTNDGTKCYTTTGSIEGCIKYFGSVCVECDDHMEVAIGGAGCNPCYSPLVKVGPYCLPSGTTIDPQCNYGNGKCNSCKDSNEYEVEGNACVLKCKQNTPTTTPTSTPSAQSPKASGNADGSSGNSIRLNIIYMAIMLMIIV